MTSWLLRKVSGVVEDSMAGEQSSTPVVDGLEAALEEATVVIDKLRQEVKDKNKLLEDEKRGAQVKEEALTAQLADLAASAANEKAEAIAKLRTDHAAQLARERSQFKLDLETAVRTHHSRHEQVVSEKENEISELNTELKRVTTPGGMLSTIFGVSPRKRKRPSESTEEDSRVLV